VVLLGGGLAEQPDGERVRRWGISGAGHHETHIFLSGAHDDGRLSAKRLTELLQPTADLAIGATEKPINAGPQQHYVGQAAIEALDRWAAGGAPPASAARLNRTADGRGCLLDEHGNATGGIRTPWVDAPTAVLSGLGQGGGVIGFLFGTTAPFEESTLASLYPGGKPDYLSRFTVALDRAIVQGFLLAEDRGEILALAEAAFP
jgi:hypothetical protein